MMNGVQLSRINRAYSHNILFLGDVMHTQKLQTHVETSSTVLHYMQISILADSL